MANPISQDPFDAAFDGYQQKLNDRWNQSFVDAVDEMSCLATTANMIAERIQRDRMADYIEDPAEFAKKMLRHLDRATKHARFALQQIAEADETCDLLVEDGVLR